MDRVKRFIVAFTVTALVAAVLAPFALAATATPSVSLKAKPASLKVDKTVTFTGTVKNAVAKDKTVKLRLVSGKTLTLEKSGTISSTGAFKLTFKAVKAGTWKFEVTYKVGKKTYKSPEVAITVTK
jgi:hypothetical protein